MNIKEAKIQIQNAMTAYFTKDEYGRYAIPIEQQRPVFLMGPPGIGKTAIMEQIASELGVGLVTYSMTHHTRQSALGLPYIVRKRYGGKEYEVSEYTMSEIIASVYEMMDSTGVKEGILFLDEVNCVSETLAPSMLQFLQYKTFGRHRVPDGWIVVTAGNPPEYNNSVREFDIVTWDRLKRIDVAPDFETWKEYAYSRGTHPAVLTYLEIKKSDFYQVETTADGKRFVTARGWSDLSGMLRQYERHGLKIDANLTRQYLQDQKIAKDFTVYYDLFNKYKSDYQIEKILSGKVGPEIKERAAAARFDERLSLLGLLLDGTSEELQKVCEQEDVLTALMDSIRKVRVRSGAGQDFGEALGKVAEERQKALNAGCQSSSMSREDQRTNQQVIAVLEDLRAEAVQEYPGDAEKAFAEIKKSFDQRVKALKRSTTAAGKTLKNLFAFCDEVFPDGQEILILVTELTINPICARYLSRYGSPEYFAHNKELLFYERQQEIIQRLETLDWSLEE